ncbi:MAG: ATP-binding protein [Gammaproteobacteria bacterium]|nr:ATP-binding protein [Gammaproteobacteria bacterium]
MYPFIETLVEETFDIIERSQKNIPREFKFPEADNMIKVAIGMRRSGKSCFLYQTIQALLKNGVSYEQILLINFEDERLLPMNAKEMGELLDSFYTLYPQNHHRRCYFFLDEVHTVDNWQQVIRRVHDKKNIQLYLTGSSSKLLSSEIATSLRGRAISIEVWPYNFQEYIVAHELKIPPLPFGQKAFDHMNNHLLTFFNTGGFPGIQSMFPHDRRETLQSYIDTVVLRDVVERHHVEKISLLKYLINSLICNAASLFSVHKFYNDIRSQGFKVSKDTIYSYIQYIEEAYLIFTVSQFSESVRLRQNAPKKIYVIDNGLIHAVSLKTNALYEKLLENQVYLDCRREGKKVYYYTTSDGYEIDFVTEDKEGNKELLQVVWDVSDEHTLLRGQRALNQACKELKLPGRIISLNDYLKAQQKNKYSHLT